MLIAALAVLNAPNYSAQEISRLPGLSGQGIRRNYFPEFSGRAQQIFKESLIRSLIKQRAGSCSSLRPKPEAVAIKRRKDDCHKLLCRLKQAMALKPVCFVSWLDFFSDDTIEQIRAASDIVDVIGSYVPLKRAGRGTSPPLPVS